MYSEIFNTDYQIRVGANQHENDALLKLAPQHAMWFHLKDFPSAHAVVINTFRNGEYNNEVIYRAATIVKNRSAIAKGLTRVSVNYLLVKYVRRTDTPGKVILMKHAKCVHI